MKLRKSRPSIAWSIGRMIVHSIPKTRPRAPRRRPSQRVPDSSPVTTNLLPLIGPHRMSPVDARSIERSHRHDVLDDESAFVDVDAGSDIETG